MVFLLIVWFFKVPTWLDTIIWGNFWIGLMLAVICLVVALVGDRSDEILELKLEPEQKGSAEEELERYNRISTLWLILAGGFLLLGIMGIIPLQMTMKHIKNKRQQNGVTP